MADALHRSGRTDQWCSNPQRQRRTHLNFNFAHDITPVAGIARSRFVMVVNSSFPARTLPEFIAYAKANPGKVNMASGGIGTSPHIFGELFKMMAGVDMVHVPYRGSVMPDLLSGQVQVAWIAKKVVRRVEALRGYLFHA
jgi:tripartite-type tricarboxylate transporter receptor subunit TctC